MCDKHLVKTPPPHWESPKPISFPTFDPSVSVLLRFEKNLLQNCTLKPHPFSPFLLTFVLVQGLITSCLGGGFCGTPSLHFILFSIIQRLTVETWPRWSLVGTCLMVLYVCTRQSQGSSTWLISPPWSDSCPILPGSAPCPSLTLGTTIQCLSLLAVHAFPWDSLCPSFCTCCSFSLGNPFFNWQLRPDPWTAWPPFCLFLCLCDYTVNSLQIGSQS